MVKQRDRVQVPISFNMNDPIEREIYEWLERMRSQSNKKGNVSAVVKKILFNYIDREKEREYARNMLALMGGKDLKGLDLSRSRTNLADLQHEEENMEIDSDSLPF